MELPFVLHMPAEQTVPVVFTSAHSGCAYPPAFVAAARLDPLSLRRSEDCFVDQLFAAAPAAGAPLLAATLPRAFCDLNREAWELDPAMFEDALPDWVNTCSARVQAGLGTIARVVGSGEPIYRGKLSFAEAERRVLECWQPWHAELARLIGATRARFGVCLLVDCHSMPSQSPARTAAGHRAGAGRPARADFVLGDAHGTSCAGAATRAVEAVLNGQGYTVARNDPYAGGYATRHYGTPGAGVHALQLEVARDLYMDEALMEKAAGFDRLAADMGGLIGSLTRQAIDLLGARA